MFIHPVELDAARGRVFGTKPERLEVNNDSITPCEPEWCVITPARYSHYANGSNTSGARAAQPCTYNFIGWLLMGRVVAARAARGARPAAGPGQ